MKNLEKNSAPFGEELENTGFSRRAEDKAQIEAMAQVIESLIKESGPRAAALYVAGHLHALQQRGNVAEESHANEQWQARHDPLTEVFNRRGFEEEMEKVISRGGDGSLVLVDLDNFSLINNLLGHAGGDNALKNVSKTITLTLRKKDIVSRHGGDEFAIYIDGDELAAFLAMNRTSDELKKLKYPVNISVGIARRLQGESLSDWLKRTDSAAYEIKGTGRDGIGIWGAPIENITRLAPAIRTKFTTATKVA